MMKVSAAALVSPLREVTGSRLRAFLL